jgi:5-methylcytosine-specific restriction endonuclease McrA
MFDYCTRELGYSEASAQRRIQAMRLLKSLPDVKNNIQDGSLSLSVAAQVQSFIQHEKPTNMLEIVKHVLHTSSRECERRLGDLATVPIKPKEKARVLSSKETLIQFTADDELNQNLEKLKQLLSHKNPQSRYDVLFKELAKIALDKLDPERRKTKPRKTPTSELKHSRYIPQALKRHVWRRDGGCCSYENPKTKKKCGSRYFVQVEHIIGFAKGGPATLENLTLLCGAHNRLKYQLESTTVSDRHVMYFQANSSRMRTFLVRTRPFR